MNNNIQYYGEILLKVSAGEGLEQGSSFSMVYSIGVQKDTSYSDGILKRQKTLEINMVDLFMSLDKSLVKSADFLRRCSCRYDGVQIGVGDLGTIEILNRETLTKQWATICSLLQSDYKGFFVDDYIMKINNIMGASEVYNMPMNNYFYYGLIFFGIPHETPVGWSRERKVIPSDFDDVIFEENLKHEMDVDDKRCFSITGKASGKPDSCQVNKFYGRTQIPTGSFFPVRTQLEVDYTKGDLNVYWKYELLQQ